MHWHIQLCIKCIFCVGERNKVPQLLQALPQLPEDILYSKLSFIFALINWIKSSTTKLNEQSHIKSLPSCRFGQLGEIPQHHALIKPLHFGQYSTKKKKKTWQMCDIEMEDGLPGYWTDVKIRQQPFCPQWAIAGLFKQNHWEMSKQTLA